MERHSIKQTVKYSSQDLGGGQTGAQCTSFPPHILLETWKPEKAALLLRRSEVCGRTRQLFP